MSAETETMARVWVGVDWGTSHRRAWRYDADTLATRVLDNQGLLASASGFGQSTARLLESLRVDARHARIVMSGMVGSASGWQEVPYLDAATPLTELPRRLVRLRRTDAPPQAWIVPGVRWRGSDAAVDVMRGEETQLLGAVQLLGERADGWYLLPGTHSKWVQLRDGRVHWMRTYLSGELFGLLRERGTLAGLMKSQHSGSAEQTWPDDEAFRQGVALSGTAALSHTLFAARARVVTGDMPAAAAAAFVSGALFGAEWHDVRRTLGLDSTVRIIGEPELAAHHAACARWLGQAVERLDILAVQEAAWSCLRTQAPA
jgi:2-dehydro-3-deoxygalactonokinase